MSVSSEKLRHVLQCVWKWSSTYKVRNQKQRFWRGILVFVMGVDQRSYVTSTMRVKTSFLDDKQEQQVKYEWFSALITVRTLRRKTRTNQVALCFWCPVPLSTYRHIVLQTPWNHGLSESLVMTLFVRCTVYWSVLVLKMSGSTTTTTHKSWPSWLCRHILSSPPREEASLWWLEN